MATPLSRAHRLQVEFEEAHSVLTDKNIWRKRGLECVSCISVADSRYEREKMDDLID